jgi:DNA-binding winged helix-turn-helix (wHTH) protein
MESRNGIIYEFADFRLIPSEGLLLQNGKPISLSLKAFSTLVFLVERHGHLVNKAELIEEVWENAFVEEAAVSRCVWTIRSALGEDSKSSRFIQTIPRRGYRFVHLVSVTTNGSGAFRLADLHGVDDRDTVFPEEQKPVTNGSANGASVGTVSAETPAPAAVQVEAPPKPFRPEWGVHYFSAVG